MENVVSLSKVVVALSVFFVWVFRFHNVIKEFQQFGLKDVTRNLVGALKIATATLLIVSLWYSNIALGAAISMSFFMAVAQYFHWRFNNPLIKKLPSLVLLFLSIFIAYFSI